jgi:hypothetical protein
MTVATGKFANVSKTKLLMKGIAGLLFKTNDTHNRLKGIFL